MSEKSKLIGSKLKIMRMQKGWRQKVLADQMGISQAHLSNIESGRSNLTMDNLFKLQELFDCPFSDFFTAVDASLQPQKKQPQPNVFTLEELAAALLAMKK